MNSPWRNPGPYDKINKTKVKSAIPFLPQEKINKDIKKLIEQQSDCSLPFLSPYGHSTTTTTISFSRTHTLSRIHSSSFSHPHFTSEPSSALPSSVLYTLCTGDCVQENQMTI